MCAELAVEVVCLVGVLEWSMRKITHAFVRKRLRRLHFVLDGIEIWGLCVLGKLMSLKSREEFIASCASNAAQCSWTVDWTDPSQCEDRPKAFSRGSVNVVLVHCVSACLGVEID